MVVLASGLTLRLKFTCGPRLAEGRQVERNEMLDRSTLKLLAKRRKKCERKDSPVD